MKEKNLNFYPLWVTLYIVSSIYFACLFVSNKRQNGWSDRAQILCGTSRDPGNGLWMMKICVKKFYMREKLLWNLQTVYYTVQKEDAKATIKSGKRRCLSQHRYFLRKKSKTWGHILERCQSFLCEKNNNIDCSFFKINSRYRVRLLRRQTELIQFLSLHFRFLALINVLITFLKHILYH